MVAQKNGSAKNGSAKNGSAKNGSAKNGSAKNGSANRIFYAKLIKFVEQIKTEARKGFG